MATNSVTILFVIASVIANHTQTTCASEAVNVACKSLKLIPGEWRYDDRDVPLISQACNVTGSGSISLFDDIIDMAGAASINSGGFVSANIRLHCTSAADRIRSLLALLVDVSALWVRAVKAVGHMETDLLFCPHKLSPTETAFSSLQSTNHTILVTLRLVNCNMTWSAVEFLGRFVTVTRVHITMLTHAWNMEPLVPADHSVGLENILRLQFTFFDLAETVLTNGILPYSTMPHVGELSVQCRNFSRFYQDCMPGLVSVDLNQLQKMLPNLQALELSSVTPLTSGGPVPFPWSHKPIFFPFNLTSSLYLQRYHGSCYKLRLCRLLSLNVSSGLADSFNLTGTMDQLSFRFINLTLIPAEISTQVRNLTYIDLSENNILAVENDSLSNLAEVEELVLLNNCITKLAEGSFDALISLRILDMSGNNLTVLQPGIFLRLVSLETFLISSNFLTTMDHTALPIGSLNLAYIDVRYNQLTSIPSVCFTLPNLQRCDCDHNWNLTLDSWNFLVEHFDPIKMLMVDAEAFYDDPYGECNPIIRHRPQQSIISIRDCNTTRMPPLNMNSRIESLKLAAFISFFMFDIGDGMYRRGGLLTCDCALYNFRQVVRYKKGNAKNILADTIFKHVSIYSYSPFESWQCIPERITGQPVQNMFLTLNDESFICTNDSLTPPCPQDCKCFSSAVNNNLFVDCYRSKLTELPGEVPEPPNKGDKLIVSFEGSQIDLNNVNCHNGNYGWLRNVTTLNLSNNSITASSMAIERLVMCLDSIRELYIGSNQIQVLPSSLQSLNLSVISVKGNRLLCCGAGWIRNWLRNNGSTFIDAADIRCLDGGGAHDIAGLGGSYFTCSTFNTVLALSVIAATVFWSMPVVYIYRLEIKVLLFDKLSLRLFDKQEEVQDAKYDVYLLYTDLDYLWVQQVLLVGLERKGFRVFDINRDAIDGQLKSDTIERALATSHRVVVVFSCNFSCNMESLLTFYRAESHQQLRQNKRYIVILASGDNSSIDNGDQSERQQFSVNAEEGYRAFRHYLVTGHYIDVGSPLFWSKLAYMLPQVQQLPDLSLPTASSTFEMRSGPPNNRPSMNQLCHRGGAYQDLIEGSGHRSFDELIPLIN